MQTQQISLKSISMNTRKQLNSIDFNENIKIQCIHFKETQYSNEVIPPNRPPQSETVEMTLLNLLRCIKQ